MPVSEGARDASACSRDTRSQRSSQRIAIITKTFFLAKDPNPITAVILRDHAPDLRFRPGGAVGGLVGPAQAKWLHPSGGNATGSIATTYCSSGLTGWTSDRCQAALMALVIVSTE